MTLPTETQSQQKADEIRKLREDIETFSVENERSARFLDEQNDVNSLRNEIAKNRVSIGHLQNLLQAENDKEDNQVLNAEKPRSRRKSVKVIGVQTYNSFENLQWSVSKKTIACWKYTHRKSLPKYIQNCRRKMHSKSWFAANFLSIYFHPARGFEQINIHLPSPNRFVCAELPPRKPFSASRSKPAKKMNVSPKYGNELIMV